MKKTLLATTILLSLHLNTVRASADQLIGNLAEVWTGPGIGSIRSPGSGTGFGIGFASGPGSFMVDSVTLEQFLYDPAANTGFHVLLYKLDYSTASTSPTMTLLGEFGNPTVNSAATQWPGETTFITYSPLSPILLQPSSQYVLAAFTAAEAAVSPDLIFSLSDAFEGLDGWQLGSDYFGLDLGGQWSWFSAFQPGHLKFNLEGSVPPNRSPDVSQAYASVTTIWPPDGKFIPFNILGASDPDGDPLTISITAIEQDEPVFGPGDKTAPDAVVDGSDTAWVRAERLGSGNGRVYRVSFTATDGKPNGTTDGVVYIQVPHDKGHRPEPIDETGSTRYYDSTAH